MKRRILLITNAGEIGDDNYCEGVYRDKDNYLRYFKEGYGGFFSEAEIKTYDKPRKTTIQKELNNLADDDIEFSIIIFCGHGFYSTISESNILCLNESERLDSLDLRKNYNKRIIILDSCREPHAVYLLEESKSYSATLLKAAQTKRKLDPSQCKRYFNKRIQDCPRQLINVYGCSIKEECGDSSEFGGYYSSSLIKASIDWANKELGDIDLEDNYSIRSISKCHQESIPRVKKLSDDQQNPVIEKPRLETILPFCVVA